MTELIVAFRSHFAQATNVFTLTMTRTKISYKIVTDSVCKIGYSVYIYIYIYI